MQTGQLADGRARATVLVESDEDEDVGYYEVDKHEPPVPVAFRVDPDLVKGLELLVKLWRILAVSRGDNPKAITKTHALSRLWRVGLEGAFAETLKGAGLEKLPTTPAEWKQLEQAIEKLARSNAR